MLSGSPRLRVLIGLAAAALIAVGWGANAADAPKPAPTVEPAGPPIPFDLTAAPRKESEIPAAVSAALAKAYYAFPDFAVLEFAPGLFAGWGIGAPRGEYVIPVTIWSGKGDRAVRLGSVELPSGGSLRSGDAVRVFAGASAGRAWLEAFGAAGAHGATYDLLLWNGSELRAVAEHFSDAPGNVVAPGAAAALRDLDGDGAPELVLDRTDPYLFHYSSGVWAGDAAVLRLVGGEAREVGIAAPDAAVGEAALGEAQAAIDFAEAGLWPLAIERAETAAQMGASDPQLVWNAIVIGERGGAALREVERSPVPWLGLLLAGDWREAVEHFRALPLASQIDLDAALGGTPLAGYESRVAELVRARATQALSAAERLSEEQVAPIYLLRGLARWWLGDGVLPAADDMVEAIAGYAPESIVYDLLWVIGYRGG